jgi:hypothetical protein
MSDIEIAKQFLKKKRLSLVVVKDGTTIFHSRLSGISGLLEAVERLRNDLNGSSVADRVVGRAAALLLASSQVGIVYALTLSVEGLKVLEENGIPLQYEKLVPKILDKSGRDICPFERFSMTISSLSEAYEKLKNFAETLKKL